MSTLFSTYQPIRRKAFACVGAIDKLNSAFSHVRFSGIFLQKESFRGSYLLQAVSQFTQMNSGYALLF